MYDSGEMEGKGCGQQTGLLEFGGSTAGGLAFGGYRQGIVLSMAEF